MKRSPTGEWLRDDGVARRVDISMFVPAETAIYKAQDAVERSGAHPLLTEASTLLQQARAKVADWVDSQPIPEPITDDEARMAAKEAADGR